MEHTHALYIGMSIVALVAIVAILATTGESAQSSYTQGSVSQLLLLGVRDVLTPGWLSVIRGMLVNENGFTPQAFAPPPYYDAAGDDGGDDAGEDYGGGNPSNCRAVDGKACKLEAGEHMIPTEGRCESILECFTCESPYVMQTLIDECFLEADLPDLSCETGAGGFCLTSMDATAVEDNGIVAAGQIPGYAVQYCCSTSEPEYPGHCPGNTQDDAFGARWCYLCESGTFNPETLRCE